MKPEQPPVSDPTRPELSGPFEQHRFGLLKGIGGSALATLGLYAALSTPRGITAEVPYGQQTTEMTAPGASTPGSEAEIAVGADQQELSKKEVITVALEQYARLFSTDRRAGEITGPQE